MKWTLEDVSENPIEAANYAFLWYHETPEFLRVPVSFYQFSEKEIFVSDFRKGISFIGKDGNILKAVVHGEEKSNNLVEGHVFCNKNTDIELIISLIRFSAVLALKKYKTVSAWIPSRHRALNYAMNKTGFNDTGLRSWCGIYKGHPLELKYYLFGEKS